MSCLLDRLRQHLSHCASTPLVGLECSQRFGAFNSNALRRAGRRVTWPVRAVCAVYPFDRPSPLVFHHVVDRRSTAWTVTYTVIDRSLPSISSHILSGMDRVDRVGPPRASSAAQPRNVRLGSCQHLVVHPPITSSDEPPLPGKANRIARLETILPSTNLSTG